MRIIKTQLKEYRRRNIVLVATDQGLGFLAPGSYSESNPVYILQNGKGGRFETWEQAESAARRQVDQLIEGE